MEYLGYSGYKVIGCDPFDSIVPEGSSLKQGISSQIIEFELNKLGSILKKSKKIKAKKYFHILTEPEIDKLISDIWRMRQIKKYVS